jgi:flagellin
VELLRINTIMIHTVEFAAKALARLDDALSNVSGERGRLGALHNRLEAAIQHSGIYQENLAAAESRIRDADMALEIMEHIKASILQQSASAMLVHANLAPQSILDILG